MSLVAAATRYFLPEIITKARSATRSQAAVPRSYKCLRDRDQVIESLTDLCMPATKRDTGRKTEMR